MTSLLGLAACESKEKAPPVQTSPTQGVEPDDAFTPFTFGLTMRRDAASGTLVLPLVEAGVAERGRMQAVIVSFDARAVPDVAIRLWQFAADDKDQSLAPTGPPTLLLDPAGEHPAVAEQLDQLRTDLVMPRGVSTILRGVEAKTPEQAVALVAKDAQTAMDPSVDGEQRARALHRAVRGFDIDLWLSSTLASDLAKLGTPRAEISVTKPGEHRATVTLRADNLVHELRLLRTPDGWVISSLETG